MMRRLINDCAPACTSKWIMKVLHKAVVRYISTATLQQPALVNRLTGPWLGSD